MRKTVAILVCAVVVVGIALVALLRTDSGGPEAYNVLLITLDTTRADRLGCYGYAKARTPALDELAAKGVLFERAYSPVPLTLPSHASILTGLNPPEHGLRDNGKRRLNSGVPTLAGILREHGYRTGAFIAAPVLDSKYGLERGFETYDDEMSDAFELGGKLVAKGYRFGDRVADSAMAWLNDVGQERFFCWVHFFDPHHPWMPHAALADTPFAGREEYDAEIAFMDRQIRRLTDFLESRGIGRRTLVVVVGDHGEGLGDHGEFTHGLMLYAATVRIPLIFTQPGSVPSGRRIGNVVGAVDVFATILDRAGIESEIVTAGQSLSPALSGETIESRPVYGETEHPYTKFRWCPQQCLTTERWKYIRSRRPELYDLEDDPDEQIDLAATRPEVLKDLEAELADIESVMVRYSAETVQLSVEEKRRLQAIGYVGEGQARDPEHRDLSSLRDVKDVKNVIERIGRSEVGRTKIVSAQELVEQSRQLVRLSPESPDLHRQLGEVVMQTGNFGEAEEIFREALRIDPSLTMARCTLGNCLIQQAKYEEAVKQLGEVLEQDPKYAEARRLLGVALANSGRIDEGIAYLREAIRQQPDSPAIHGWLANLGAMLARQGDLAAAAEQCRRALEKKPDFADARMILGDVLSKTGDHSGALAQYQHVLQADPAATRARLKLADEWIAAGRTQQAEKVLRGGLRMADGRLPVLRKLGTIAGTEKAWSRAARYYRQAVKEPGVQWTDHYSLGLALMRLNREDHAIEVFDRAIRLDTQGRGAHLKVGLAWVDQGRYDRAVKIFRQGLKQRPDDLNLLNSLAWVLASCPDSRIRDGAEAVRLAQVVRKTAGDKNANVLDTLAAAQAQAGLFAEAVTTAGKALEIARAGKEDRLAGEIQMRLDLYKRGKPYRDSRPEN